MALTASGFVHQSAIDSAVRNVENSFASKVARIGYSLGEDAIGSPSIYVRVLVRDEAAPLAHLRELAQNLSIALMNEVKTDENGLHAYFNFRSVSEQEQLRDPAWD